MSEFILQIHCDDNVAVALKPLKPHTEISPSIQCQSTIPQRHKVVIKCIPINSPVVMYGVTVGRSLRNLRAGDRLNQSDLIHDISPYTLDNHHTPPPWRAPDISKWSNTTFAGYHRSDGQVGTANHWIVVPMVFCENRNIDVLRRAFEDELGYSHHSAYRQHVASLVNAHLHGRSVSVQSELKSKRVFKNIDGIHFLTHQLGCGGTREDAKSLCGLLAGYLNHPNVFGATILSLGCENAEINLLMEEVHRRNPNFDKPLYLFSQQSFSSTDQLITHAINDTFAGLMEGDQFQREPSPLSKLTVGLECGGSDGFSGISANPAMGHATDLLIAAGGRAILGEFPELSGQEQALIDRCLKKSTATRFIDLMESYASLAHAVGSGFDMNPTSGNITDGLLTGAMKSAGAARKGGTSPITDVIDYPEYATSSGLNLLCTPGSDVESTTAIAGSGAQIILFSTGMGTPTGNPIAQVIKVSSNSLLANRLPDLIDYNAGAIIDGHETIESAGAQLFDLIVEAASGNYTPASARLGQNDFIPWKRGPSL